MKVILLTELKGKGGEGDVVEVAPGFFNNYLGPQKMAILATKHFMFTTCGILYEHGLRGGA